MAEALGELVLVLPPPAPVRRRRRRRGPGRPCRRRPRRRRPSGRRLLQVDVPAAEAPRPVAEPNQTEWARRGGMQHQHVAGPGAASRSALRSRATHSRERHLAEGRARRPRRSSRHGAAVRRSTAAARARRRRPPGPTPDPAEQAVAHGCCRSQRPSRPGARRIGRDAQYERARIGDQVRLVLGVRHRAVGADQAAHGDALAVGLRLAVDADRRPRHPGPAGRRPPRSRRPASTLDACAPRGAPAPRRSSACWSASSAASTAPTTSASGTGVFDAVDPADHDHVAGGEVARADLDPYRDSPCSSASTARRPNGVSTRSSKPTRTPGVAQRRRAAWPPPPARRRRP